MSLKNTAFSIKEINELFTNAERIFFIGIGGISMSAIAEYCAMLGKEIYGYDNCRSLQAIHLEKLGKIKYSSTPDNVNGMDMVIYTNAIDEKNLEYRQARRLKIPAISRGNFLGFLISLHKRKIGISGMHGKSTTTAMLGNIFYHAGENPTVFCGANMINFGSNFKFGGRTCCIFEACEYQNSFLNFTTTDAVVLNIDFDHPDFFSDINQVKDSFCKYICNADRAIMNCDDKNIQELCHKNAVTFGFDKLATYRGVLCKSKSDEQNVSKSSFAVYKHGEYLATVTIPFCGLHMVYNSLCAFAVAHVSGIPIDKICQGLSSFQGIKRRMELLGNNDTGAHVFEDYAHHPTEIKATLSSLKEMGYKDILCIFQAHTYSRTHYLYEEFKSAFKDATELIVAPTFSAREENVFELSEEKFALDCGGEFISSISKIRHRVSKSNCGCIVLMGAGDLAQKLHILLN